jgi:hypothetical protein
VTIVVDLVVTAHYASRLSGSIHFDVHGTEVAAKGAAGRGAEPYAVTLLLGALCPRWNSTCRARHANPRPAR